MYKRQDINVIGLIGERGREVREFLENDLKEEGLKKSVVVIVTSDQPALVRVKGCLLYTSCFCPLLAAFMFWKLYQ